MSDDLLKRLRNTPNWMREEYAHYKDGLKVFDRAPFEAAYALEAQAAEITRLRAERNAEISARFKAEGEFSTMQRRIARQRRALAKMYQRRHDKNAALATARRDALAEIKQDTDELIEQGRQDGMEQAAQRLEELHKNHGYNPQTGEVWRLGKIVTCPLPIGHAIGYYCAIAEGVVHIRAAAGGGEVK